MPLRSDSLSAMASDTTGIRTTAQLQPLPDLFTRLHGEAAGQTRSALDLAQLVPEPQDAPPLRWGIIGAGAIAGTFAMDVPDLSSGIITAVGSRDYARAQAFLDCRPATAKGGPARAYGSYADLLAADDVDAVYIATPHIFHAEQALAALDAGKHVLVEKPMTINAAQARQIYERARERGLFVMEALWTRFLPGHLVAHELMESGVCGPIRHVRADHFQTLLDVERLIRPELAGGALLDLGVYSLSFIHSILGRPQRVQAMGVCNADGVDLHESVTLEYPQATGVASAGMDSTGTNTAHVQGPAARLDFGRWFYTPTTLTLTSRDSAAHEESATWDASVRGGFQFEAAEAARCIAAGRIESEILPWQATLEVLDMMDQVRAQLGVRYPGE